MELSKSQIKFYLDMFICTYYDVVSASFVSQREQRRDIEEIQHRVAHEGISFLTKSLPRLGKSIDQSLGSGTTLQVHGFVKKPGTAIPKFLGGLLSVLFNDDGSLRVAPATASEETPEGALLRHGANCNTPLGTDLMCACRPSRADQNPSRETMVLALKALRQMLFMLYKLELPHSDEQENQVIQTFIETDEGLPESKSDFGESADVILCVARNLIAKILCNADPLSGNPRHGKGAVATGESPCEKHRFKRFYRKLAAVFPYEDWFFYGPTHLVDNLDKFLNAPEEDAGTAKVVLVPKDSRGPRLISCEPLEYQWIQQALMRVLTSTIEQHPITKGQVNFTNQEINRELALEGSRTGRYVTLDMKEASDRVSKILVDTLFPEHWTRALTSARSTRTRLPDGRLVEMKKFAPMGSAVCFPVEALVFYSLAVAGLHIYANMTLRNASSLIFVYGDDIICRREHHSVIVSVLESFGLLLNHSKCCTAGFFRESCGMDAFYGHSVTPTRLRTVYKCRHRSGAILASYVAFHNAMYAAGNIHTANYIFWSLQETWRWTIPVVSSGSNSTDNGGPSDIAFVRSDISDVAPLLKIPKRYNQDLQRLEYKGYMIQPHFHKVEATSWGQLLEETLKYRPTLQELTQNYFVEVNAFSDGCSQLQRDKSCIEYPIVHRDTLCRTWSRMR